MGELDEVPSTPRIAHVHEILAAMRWQLDGESSMLRLTCSDPTCIWGHTEFNGDLSELGPEDLPEELTRDVEPDCDHWSRFRAAARRHAEGSAGSSPGQFTLFEAPQEGAGGHQ